MKRCMLVFLTYLGLLSACQPNPTLVPTRDPSIGRCGDNICNGPENQINCEIDCGEEFPMPPEWITQTALAGKITPQTTSTLQQPQEKAVVYIGIMVHLEGWSDDQNQMRFEDHAQKLREYASLFETYGAKLTLESKEVTDGALKWGDNVLLEMQQRGHGVGVHADIGGERDYECSRLVEELRFERMQLEELGVTVRHVSGNTSHCDWVQGTMDAGYVFTTGQVAYSLMSLPEEQRPPEYRDCPSPAACHQVYPEALADRLVPWRPAGGEDWLTHDPNGGLVLLPGSGGLACLEEEVIKQKFKSCEFTTQDIDQYFKELELALELARPGQVNIYYVSWSFGQALDPQLVEEWLRRIEPYVVQGKVAWKSLPEMYDLYMEN